MTSVLWISGINMFMSLQIPFVQFTILLVGYFVLGPSDLYKLTKEIGKFVQNFRTFTSEATATLETNMENQLQLEEIRKAQRELTEAFSFRRSINVDKDTDPFEVNAQSPRLAVEEEITEVAGVTSTLAPHKTKKVRRVKKKKVDFSPIDIDKSSLDASASTNLANNVPDLDLDDPSSDTADRAMESIQAARDKLAKEQEVATVEEPIAQRHQERLERLQRAGESSPANGQVAMAEQSRFQQQLSGQWNNQILTNEEKLDPLATIMQRLAVLEEEKVATDLRLQEEFRLREENEERFYREKRQLLDEAAANAKVQASSYASTVASPSSTSATGSEGNN
jgi:Sec-independent protein translocase protein TatA